MQRMELRALSIQGNGAEKEDGGSSWSFRWIFNCHYLLFFRKKQQQQDTHTRTEKVENSLISLVADDLLASPFVSEIL